LRRATEPWSFGEQGVNVDHGKVMQNSLILQLGIDGSGLVCWGVFDLGDAKWGFILQPASRFATGDDCC
jgi:hypothetical protein